MFAIVILFCIISIWFCLCMPTCIVSILLCLCMPRMSINTIVWVLQSLQWVLLWIDHRAMGSRWFSKAWDVWVGGSNHCHCPHVNLGSKQSPIKNRPSKISKASNFIQMKILRVITCNLNGIQVPKFDFKYNEWNSNSMEEIWIANWYIKYWKFSHNYVVEKNPLKAYIYIYAKDTIFFILLYFEIDKIDFNLELFKGWFMECKVVLIKLVLMNHHHWNNN